MKPARGSEEWWRDYLVNGHRLEGIARLFFPWLPSSPRCKVCHAPFRGFGRLMRPFGWSPSLKNPNICGFCSDRLPAGGAEIPVAVVVADVRGYTQLSETMPPQEIAALMSEFFQIATSTFTAKGALIDKYMGDAIQVLFIPGAMGSVVNIVNRIQGAAQPKEILVSDDVVMALGLTAPESRDLDLKGVTELTKVWVF